MKGILCGMLMLVTMIANGTDRYVSLNGNHTSPFTSWSDAATNIQDAVSVANEGDCIYVTNQTTYLLTGEVTIAKTLVLRSYAGGTNQLDRDTTVLDANNYVGKSVTNRCLYVTATNAFIAGFTITNGRVNNTEMGGGVYIITGSTLSNCVVTDCINTNYTYTSSRGGGIYTRDGNVVDCRIVRNSLYIGTYGYYNGGGGIHITGSNGLVSGCTIRDNCLYASGVNAGGGGVYMDGGLLSNCDISGNFVTNGAAWSGGGGVQAYGGATRNCTIRSNTVYSGSTGGGGIYCSASRDGHTVERAIDLRNTTISHNRSSGNGGGVFARDATGAGTIENCVVYTNVSITGGAGIYLSATANPLTNTDCSIRNCLIYKNACTNAATIGGGIYGTYYEGEVSCCTIVGNVVGWDGGGTRPGKGIYLNSIICSNVAITDHNQDNITPAQKGQCNYCCSPCLTSGTGNITNDPCLVDYPNCDFTVRSDSPCVNAGTNEAWMAGARDLNDRTRVDFFQQHVDMGAYEYVCRGMVFIFDGH